MSNKMYVAAADYTSLLNAQAVLDAQVPAVCAAITALRTLYQSFVGQAYAADGETGTMGVGADFSDDQIIARFAAMLANGGCAVVLDAGSNQDYQAGVTFAGLIGNFASGTAWNQP